MTVMPMNVAGPATRNIRLATRPESASPMIAVEKLKNNTVATTQRNSSTVTNMYFSRRYLPANRPRA